MSMVTTNVAQVLTQEAGLVAAVEAEVAVRKAPARPYKARMATKVKWALGDIMEASIDAERRFDNLLQWMNEARAHADASGDTALLALLGKFSHEMNHLQRDVSKIMQSATQAVAESKPQAKEKKSYSEL